MNTKLVIFIFLLIKLSGVTGNVYAEEDLLEEKHPLDDFQILSDAIPTEFTLMLTHLKASELNKDQLRRISVAADLINKELAKVPAINIMFFLKTEFYKGILNNQYLKMGNRLQISSSIITSAKQKLKKHAIVYTRFSKWIIESILKDFDPFLIKNFINEYQNIKRTNINGQLKVKKLMKILKYVTPWLDSFNHSIPEEFNTLCTDIIIDTLENISKKTYFFATFTGKLEKLEAVPLLTVPTIQFKQEKVEQPKTESFKEESAQRKDQAKEDVKNLETDDLSGASEAIDKLTN